MIYSHVIACTELKPYSFFHRRLRWPNQLADLSSLWVTLPRSVQVGRFRFCPLSVKDVRSIIDPDMVTTVEHALKCYVRKNGKPIESCTIVLRARHPMAWNIPRQHWKYANSAAKILALASLAEQRFFEEHFSPHLNATMFHLIGQGVTAGSDQISPFYSRRGGGLQIGGLRFKDIVFQRPSQVEGTECGPINDRLLKAIKLARRFKTHSIQAIDSSLELFLLAHSETPELDLDSCVMLSAMAFERLLGANEEQRPSNSLDVCGLLGSIFENYDRGR